MLNVDYEQLGAVVDLLLAQRGNAPECLGYEVGAPSLADSRLPYRHVTGKIPMGHCAKLGMDLYCDEGSDTCFVMEQGLPRTYDAANQ